MKIIFIGICAIIMLVILIWDPDYGDYQYKIIATKAMQQECARNCSSHGVSLKSFGAPELILRKTGRSYAHYIFSWQSKTNPIVILRVDYTWLWKNEEHITFQWITL